jgi:phage regulator Rha-like protein
MSDLIPAEVITSKIYQIRSHKVMLDRDLAHLYGVETKVLKQAVRRNINRFPEDFMFELSWEEEESLRSQTVTLKARGMHSKYLSFAFTEQGVAMLSTVLKSERAIEVNIAIMRAFVQMRDLLSTNKKLAKKLVELEKRLTEHDENFQVVFEAIKQLLTDDEKPKRKIGF